MIDAISHKAEQSHANEYADTCFYEVRVIDVNTYDHKDEVVGYAFGEALAAWEKAVRDNPTKRVLLMNYGSTLRDQFPRTKYSTPYTEQPSKGFLVRGVILALGEMRPRMVVKPGEYLEEFFMKVKTNTGKILLTMVHCDRATPQERAGKHNGGQPGIGDEVEFGFWKSNKTTPEGETWTSPCTKTRAFSFETPGLKEKLAEEAAHTVTEEEFFGDEMPHICTDLEKKSKGIDFEKLLKEQEWSSSFSGSFMDSLSPEHYKELKENYKNNCDSFSGSFMDGLSEEHYKELKAVFSKNIMDDYDTVGKVLDLADEIIKHSDKKENAQLIEDRQVSSDELDKGWTKEDPLDSADLIRERHSPNESWNPTLDRSSSFSDLPSGCTDLDGDVNFGGDY